MKTIKKTNFKIILERGVPSGGVVPEPENLYIVIDNQENILFTNQDEWIIAT